VHISSPWIQLLEVEISNQELLFGVLILVGKGLGLSRETVHGVGVCATRICKRRIGIGRKATVLEGLVVRHGVSIGWMSWARVR
jgi:hypothetical protein